jgi:hypothetical protein
MLLSTWQACHSAIKTIQSSLVCWNSLLGHVRSIAITCCRLPPTTASYDYSTFATTTAILEQVVVVVSFARGCVHDNDGGYISNMSTKSDRIAIDWSRLFPVFLFPGFFWSMCAWFCVSLAHGFGLPWSASSSVSLTPPAFTVQPFSYS